MITDELIQAEKEYLVNVLGKTIIDSDEIWTGPGLKLDGTYYYGYNALAKKYLLNDFVTGKRNHIHHINFDHSDDRLCNLVVLTSSEHRIIHYMFDPKAEDTKLKLRDAVLGTVQSEELNKKRGEKLKGHPNYFITGHTNETKNRISKSLKGYKRGPLSEEHKRRISETLKKHNKGSN